MPGSYVVPEAYRAKWGQYLPHQRLNVDQVPLPFVNDFDTTYNERGDKARVAIQAGGPSLSKRQATGQVCIDMKGRLNVCFSLINSCVRRCIYN